MGNSKISLAILALLLACFNGFCFSATDHADASYVSKTGSLGVVLADLPATYCVAKSFGVDQDTMLAALSWTCAMVDCSPLQQGNRCFEPDTIPAHASFAFNLYYQQNGRLTGACNFNGTAIVTTTDPSHGSCTFPNYLLAPATKSTGFRFRVTGGALVMLWMTMTLFY